MTTSITVAAVLLDTHWKKDGTNFYRIRLTKGRKHKYIKTNILVRKEMIRGGRLADAQTRYKVESIVRRAEAAIASLDTFAVDAMNLDDVAEYVTNYNTDGFSLEFFAFGRDLVADRKRSVKALYNSALNCLAAFMGTDRMDISRITSSMMRSWEEWLRKKYGNGARAVSSYTSCIAYIHGQARSRFNDEERGRIPIKNPFHYYKPPRQKKAEHRVLPDGVLQQMIDLRAGLSGRERLGVDVFLISYALMGMNAPDLYSCAAPEKGGLLRYYRTKTRERRDDHAEMLVRMEPELKGLFSEYRGDGGYAFDFHGRYAEARFFGDNVNRGLQKFCERIGIRRVSLYWARHTWASAAFRFGVEKGIINDCLCHVDKDMKVTDIYIKKDWKRLWEANRKVLSANRW